MSLKHKFVFSLALLMSMLTIILIYKSIFVDEGKQNKNNKIKIGLSLDSLVVERWQRDRTVFLEKAKELGADVVEQNSGGDSDEQINQIKYLISQKINVLVIVPNDSDALAPVVNEAKKKGIKVICYDRIIRKADADLYVTFDNERVGQLMSEAMVQKVPKGNYVIINGNPKDYNAVLFNKGFKDILNPKIKNGDINILKEAWAKGWKAEDAYNTVEDVISKNNNIDAVIAANDTLAESAIQALSENRMAGKVFVVGGDADLAGCQRVVEGLQLMTVYKPIVNLSQDAANAAVNLARGKKIETTETINDGMYNIPIILEHSTTVNKDNMIDVIVKSNFHNFEDIYRNVPKDLRPKY